MTILDMAEIISESSLWETLTFSEKIDALSHALKTVEAQLCGLGDGQTDIADIIGEIFSE